jgi:hypothetical protein
MRRAQADDQTPPPDSSSTSPTVNDSKINSSDSSSSDGWIGRFVIAMTSIVVIGWIINMVVDWFKGVF